MNIEGRGLFDWIIFVLIHLVLIGGIAVAGFYVYGFGLGVWVAASAVIAGLALSYLFARDVPGETLMKVLIYLFATLNAAYLVHNGAKALGVQSFNDAQIQKYEKGMAQAAQSTSRKVAYVLGKSAQESSEIARSFDDGVAVVVSILAFLELFTALVTLSLASRRNKSQIYAQARERLRSPESDELFNKVEEAEEFNGQSGSNLKAHR